MESIAQNGLRVNDNGELFLFEGMDYNWNCYNWDEDKLEKHWVGIDRLIAVNQLFIKEYAMYEVDVPAKYLEDDDVAELTAQHQHIYRFNIPPHKVRLVKTEKFDARRFWE